MAAKTWYKPSAIPQLIARFSRNNRDVEVWTTTCIVTKFGKQAQDHYESPQCTALINPANPNLTGPNSFPYFPRGGPQPALQPTRDAHHIMGYVSQWGGMDVGTGMLFSAEAIDGLVHQLGGLRFHAECKLVPTHDYTRAYLNQQTTQPEVKNDEDNQSTHKLNKGDMQAKCPVGTAVVTSSGGDDLQKHYDFIIHTTPPFYRHPPCQTKELKQILEIKDAVVSDTHSWSKELLRSCYRQSFNLALDCNSYMKSNYFSNLLGMVGLIKPAYRHNKRVAVPLLGAGCRDFPKELALEVAALESAAWLSNLDSDIPDNSEEIDAAVVFGLLEEADAKSLSDQIEKLL
mmetsp:Transcript_32681/g.48395  ORF Transcript_32681/g.48395 Transcript_32681/m.48395 type:complete len:345 (+) Transcript_32681:220-1254(+)